MRVFQKRMLSGRPLRSRGPGSSSRKKSASWASKERNPFGTILTGLLSRPDLGVQEDPDRVGVAGAGADLLLAQAQSEVADNRLAIEIEQNVAWLDIAVEDSLPMGIVKCLSHDSDQVDRVAQRGPTVLDLPGQGAAFDKP